MSQAMYTSASGMSAAQTQINVVSNNIANMNTVAFKESSVNFADVFYGKLSAGSPSTPTSGGVNPKEVGYGTQVAQISQNFNTGTFQSTGITTDLMIQGNGFFTVMTPGGDMKYTKAGNFSVDNNGFLVNPNGYKVLGTDSAFGTTSDDFAIKIPQLVHSEVTPNENTGSKNLSELNGIDGITKGTFGVTVTYDDAGVTKNLSVTVDITGANNLNEICTAFNTAFNAAAPDALDDKVVASIIDGKFQLKCEAPATSMSMVSGTSNFLNETELGGAESENGIIQSKVLDWIGSLSPSVNKQVDLSASGYEIYENGSIEVTYSNGDKLRVIQIEGTTQMEFQYTTSEGVVMNGKEINVSEDVATVGNLQIQLAHFMNPDGLEQEGNNLFSIGINTGEAIYGIANSSLFGGIKSGGLEASNVDLTKQFADMIIAQRAIEANSRVFNTANQVMQSLVYLGQ